jgi:hypothetical protein
MLNSVEHRSTSEQAVTVLVEREPYDFFGGLTYDCDGFQRASDSLKDRQFYISVLDGGAGNDTTELS